MGLGYVGKIFETHPIEGADRIHTAVVDCGAGGVWTGVVSKDMNPDSWCEVFMQDCILPAGERFDFMDKYHRRVSMKRFKGAPSDCLIMPITVMGVEKGFDLTETLGLVKYDKPIPTNGGEICGPFNPLYAKTDEPNFQSVPELVREVLQGPWEARLKYDGTSCTIAKDETGLMRVYGRNWEIREGENIYWQIARKYDLQSKMGPLECIQMEIIGPGVQGNPLKLGEIKARAFNYFVGKEPRWISGEEVHGIPVAQCMFSSTAWHWRHGGEGDFTREELWKMAEVKYPIGVPGEGLVFRRLFGGRSKTTGERLSFKVINLLYGK